MSENVILIVDDESPEPMVPAIQQSLGPDVISVWPLSHVIADAGIAFDNGEARIEEFSLSAVDVSLEYVLDRVVEITPTTVLNVDKSGLSALGQVSDAYQAILDHYVGQENAHTLYSTIGRVVPLFSQWARIRPALRDVSVPTYLYGYGPEPIADDALPDAIHKSPFDLYGWKKNAPSPMTVYDKFVVSRPAGTPILSYIVGDHIDVMSLDTGEKFDSADIVDHTRRASEVFGTSVGEILWFVDDDDVTFAAFSHKLFAAASTSGFKENAGQILENLKHMSSSW